MSFHAVIVAVGLFALTFMSPGPNLFLIVQTSLSQGKSAGMAAGAGVAAGDAIYAALGLLGMTTLMSTSYLLFSGIQILGGAYLIWYGWNMICCASQPATSASTGIVSAVAHRTHFRRGIITDLANAQTVLFFASIFSVTINPSTTWPTKLAIWLGIVMTSVSWRLIVSVAFSRPSVRLGYMKMKTTLERFVGLVLIGFGIKLIYGGVKPV